MPRLPRIVRFLFASQKARTIRADRDLPERRASGQYGIFTSSQDGNILYCWVADGRGGASFKGAAKIDGKFIPAPAKPWPPTDRNTKHAVELP